MMDPWQSWAIVLAIAGAFYWYYTRDQRPQPTRSRTNTGAEITQPHKSTKKEERARRKPAIGSASEQSGADTPLAPAVQSVAAQKRANKKKPSQSSLRASHSSEAEDEAADRKWAEQLAKARKGTNLTVPSKDAGRTRTVKTSAANNTGSDFDSNSTGGADADDDLTPGISPTIQAGDVSDMLEPKQAGPSVLRLTEPANPMPQRAPRPQKEFQVAETKKQRQNRRKNEERKAANQDIEADRQAQLEKQRRTAREARGEPARNGVQQAKAPAASVWTNTSGSTGSQASQPLLNTFEKTQPTPTGNNVSAPLPVNGNGAHEYADGLSEEQQFNLASKISEDEDGWNTVATKKAKKQPDAQAAKTNNTVIAQTANGFANLPDEA